MKLFKNTFFSGLLLALVVVLTDFLQAYISNTHVSVNGFIIAALIAVVGYLGKFLNGVANTNVSMIGSALLAIIPLITEGHIDVKMIAATFLLKLLGLLTQGKAEPLKQ
jgi:uncharacterized membrane protein